MVLEGIISPAKAKKRPLEMILLGALYSSIAIVVALNLFYEYASLVMVFFTVFASLPLVYFAIKQEEQKDMELNKNTLLLKEHGKALAMFMFLFIGYVLSFAIWYLALPTGTSSQLFNVQTTTILRINNPLSGHAFNITSTYMNILLNNLKVMTFCLIFAFFYGFGAIFILTWNAAIIGTAIGIFVKNQVGSIVTVLPLALAKYLVHGIPEILAYFMAGLAGGIISIAVIRHDFGTVKFKNILVDSLDLIIGAVVILMIAGGLEVFVSPLIG